MLVDRYTFNYIYIHIYTQHHCSTNSVAIYALRPCHITTSTPVCACVFSVHVCSVSQSSTLTNLCEFRCGGECRAEGSAELYRRSGLVISRMQGTRCDAEFAVPVLVASWWRRWRPQMTGEIWMCESAAAIAGYTIKWL